LEFTIKIQSFKDKSDISGTLYSRLKFSPVGDRSQGRTSVEGEEENDVGHGPEKEEEAEDGHGGYHDDVILGLVSGLDCPDCLDCPDGLDYVHG
jgi:hypothetical protein